MANELGERLDELKVEVEGGQDRIDEALRIAQEGTATPRPARVPPAKPVAPVTEKIGLGTPAFTSEIEARLGLLRAKLKALGNKNPDVSKKLSAQIAKIQSDAAAAAAEGAKK